MTPIPGFQVLNGGFTVHAEPCYCPKCDRPPQESFSLSDQSRWHSQDFKAVQKEIAG